MPAEQRLLAICGVISLLLVYQMATALLGRSARSDKFVIMVAAVAFLAAAVLMIPIGTGSLRSQAARYATPTSHSKLKPISEIAQSPTQNPKPLNLAHKPPESPLTTSVPKFNRLAAPWKLTMLTHTKRRLHQGAADDTPLLAAPEPGERLHRRTVSAPLEAGASCGDFAESQGPEDAKPSATTALRELTLPQCLCSVDYWMLWLALFIGIGSGFTLLNNFGESRPAACPPAPALRVSGFDSGRLH